MSTLRNPREVLRYFAECLDITRTLEAFPDADREGIRRLILRAVETLPPGNGHALLWIDGAARGNPGQAGAGVVLESGEDNTLYLGEYLGKATNNEAEYRALILGMEVAGSQGCGELEVRSDSELLVRQMRGEYRVKNARLQELYFQAVKGMAQFKKVVFTHIPREENREADKLANMAIDSKGKVSL
jgi:ribonuclease HI